MLVILDPVILEEIDFVLHLLHLLEVGANVIFARLDGQVLHLPLLGSVVDDHLRLHDRKRHHKKDQATRDLPPRSIICIDELALLGMEEFLACTRDTVLQNEVKAPNKLPETNIVSIHEVEVTSLVQINSVELHVSGLGEGGIFVAHKPPGEGTDLVKINLVVGHEDVDVVPHIRIPVVYPNDSLWINVDCYRSGRRDVHDVVQHELF